MIISCSKSQVIRNATSCSQLLLSKAVDFQDGCQRACYITWDLHIVAQDAPTGAFYCTAIINEQGGGQDTAERLIMNEQRQTEWGKERRTAGTTHTHTQNLTYTRVSIIKNSYLTKSTVKYTHIWMCTFTHRYLTEDGTVLVCCYGYQSEYEIWSRLFWVRDLKVYQIPKHCTALCEISDRQYVSGCRCVLQLKLSQVQHLCWHQHCINASASKSSVFTQCWCYLNTAFFLSQLGFEFHTWPSLLFIPLTLYSLSWWPVLRSSDYN